MPYTYKHGDRPLDGISVQRAVGRGGFGEVYYALTDSGKQMADKFKLKIPVLGGILMNLAVARFCRVLGTLLNNGVPILRSLEISSDATGNRVLARAIQQATENISAGESLR